jgi:hypothetical protein
VADRTVLRQAILDDAGTADDIADLIEDYAILFGRHPDWLRVYSGGLTTIGRELVDLLTVSKRLMNLRTYGRIDHFLAGLATTEQVNATLFEILIGDWLTTREVHRGLIFEPAVSKGNSIKHPEFLWSTSQGDLYVECKTASSFLTAKTRSLGRLMKSAGDAYEQSDWPDNSRVDITIERAALNGCDRRIAAVLRQLAQVEMGTSIKNGEVVAMLSSRGQDLMKRRGYLINSLITVGQTPTLLGPTSSHLTIALPIRKAADRQLRSLIKEARRQLPDDGYSAIIVEASQRSVDTFLDAARQLVGQPEYKATPILGIFDGQRLHITSRSDSPFDGDFLQG